MPASSIRSSAIQPHAPGTPNARASQVSGKASADCMSPSSGAPPYTDGLSSGR